jgi:phosphopantothenoylcysteine decarboxylase/phosphopantothenate--cysteine ligase
MSASDAPASPPGADLVGRRVVVCVTGGIAAYKTATLVSRLAQAGAVVRVVMTQAATHFITPLTLQSLSGREVVTEIWQTADRPDSQHVGTARWAQLVIIAPASTDIIAKVAAGICDDPVSLTVVALPRTTPVLVAPAMNEQMWENPVTQRNITTLRDLLGHHIIGPDSGWQACRTKGVGRMSEPEMIFDRVKSILAETAAH